MTDAKELEDLFAAFEFLANGPGLQQEAAGADAVTEDAKAAGREINMGSSDSSSSGGGNELRSSSSTSMDEPSTTLSPFMSNLKSTLQQLHMPDDLLELILFLPCQQWPACVTTTQLIRALERMAAAIDHKQPEQQLVAWWSAGVLVGWARRTQIQAKWRGRTLKSFSGLEGNVPEVALSEIGEMAKQMDR